MKTQGTGKRSARSRKHSRKAKIWMAAAAALVVLLLVAGLVIRSRVYDALWTPFRGYQGAYAQVSIHKGMTSEEIAVAMEKAGVVQNGWIFAKYIAWKGLDARIPQGVYRFDRPMTGQEVAEKLVRGDVFRIKVTFPEGWAAHQMFRRLEAAGIGKYDAYMTLWKDPARLHDVAGDARSLEGFLFPDTYFFSPDVTEDQVIAVLTGAFRKQCLPLLSSSVPRGKPLSTGELVTIASIVEKETAVPEERPLVASVIYTRLAKGMKVQCDPTVIYARWLETRSDDPVIYRSDLQRESPYNTYLYAGLPPGPICNPGRESIQAACRPAETRYLYFVANGKGGHTFSADLAAHNRAVALYRKK